jgi:hypothetical protein
VIPRFNYLTENITAFKFFNDQGFVILTNVFEMSLVENIKSELQSVIQLQVVKHLNGRDDLISGNGFDRGLIELSEKNDLLRQRLYEAIQGLPSLYKFIFNSMFLELTDDYGVSKPSLRTPQFRMDLPHDDRFLQGVHQEVRSIKSPNMFFMIVPLVDTSCKKGSLGVAPGSHRLGPLKPSVDDKLAYQYISPDKYLDYPLTQLEYSCGEVIILNMYTLHCSFSNKTDETRWAAIFRSEDISNMPFLDGNDSFLEYTLKG